jgi:hypothetical protein
VTEEAANEPHSELAQVTAWIQRLTRDPMADAVPGRVRVASASAPPPRGRYGQCRLELVVEVRGLPATTVTHTAVFPRRHWPEAGLVVPANVSRSNPEVFEADWSRLSGS